MFLKELDCYFALLQVFLLVVNLFSLILLLLKIGTGRETRRQQDVDCLRL